MAVELENHSLRNDANLVAYYRLEDLVATVGTNLTNQNVATFVAAQFNNGGNFVRASLQALKNTVNAVSNGNATLMGWIKVTVEPDADFVRYGFIACLDGTNFVTYSIDYQFNGGTPRLRFLRTKNGVADQAALYTITLGTTDFYHLAITYDGTNIRGYVNGVLQAGPTAASGNGSSGTVDGIIIGAANGGGAGPDTTAESSSVIDDVGIFTRALSGTEISDFYNATSGKFFQLLGVGT